MSSNSPWNMRNDGRKSTLMLSPAAMRADELWIRPIPARRRMKTSTLFDINLCLQDMRSSGLDFVACRKPPSRRPSRPANAAIRQLVGSQGRKLPTVSRRAAGEPPIPANEGHVHRRWSGGGVGGASCVFCCVCMGAALVLCTVV